MTTRATASLLGDSAAMQLVRRQIEALGPLEATVLIEGETGTGKELVARALHDASPRRQAPFVVLPCVGLTESLLASQWFGHARGALPGAVSDEAGLFEAAHGGTLLLDEIGDLPIGLQAYLPRILHERRIVRLGDSRARAIDVRVLAATQRDLEPEAAAGRFRRDLIYRIRAARIRLPPLRARRDDIPLLALTSLRQAAIVFGKAVDGISAQAMARLGAHPWPGNVRELQSIMASAVVLATDHIVHTIDLPAELVGESLPAVRHPVSPLDRQRLLQGLKQAGGNRSEAARLLGVSRATLYRRLAALTGEGDRRED